MAYASQTRLLNTSLFGRLANLRTNLVDRWQRYSVYRTTRNELDALSERELADLGIARGSIHEIATFAAYGK